MVESRNFEEDLINSNKPKLRESWADIFKLKFGNDCEIKWKDDLQEQKGFGTDVTIKTKTGRRYSIELKTRYYKCLKNDKWIMEIVSHIYNKEEKPREYLHKKDGWIYTTTAEYLFHATLDQSGENIIECIFYSLKPFKDIGYKSEFDKYEILWLPTTFSNGNFQLTLNKLIPKDVIKKDALEFWELVKE